jgi:hypothetical protein
VYSSDPADWRESPLYAALAEKERRLIGERPEARRGRRIEPGADHRAERAERIDPLPMRSHPIAISISSSWITRSLTSLAQV